ncbi:MAG: hypothetical protein WD557_16315 [Dehalococcoidia bacterium]
MRIPPWALLSGGLVLIAGVIAAVMILSAGGDDDPTLAAGTPTPTRAPSDAFGPTPTMTEHVSEVLPAHGERIQQQATRRGAATLTPRGVCAVVSYKDLPENNQWFRIAVDDKEVTAEKDSVTLILDGTEADPQGATMCYAPPDGLSLGLHSAAIAVQDPKSTGGVPQELVAWKFEVIE